MQDYRYASGQTILLSILALFLSPYTSILMANLKLLLVIVLHWMMWLMFARCACNIHAHVFAARVKCSKVWAHNTKLSDTSVQCNICSSVIVNKGGNTSNIMKYLLTKHNIYLKQCAAFTMSPDSWDIHIKCWFRGIVTLTRHCTYSQSQKYIKRQHKSTHTRFTQWWKWPKFTSSLGGGGNNGNFRLRFGCI